MSLTVIAVGAFFASALAFGRYWFGRFMDTLPKDVEGESVFARLDRNSWIRTKRFHLVAGWSMLATGLVVGVAAVIQAVR